MKESNMNECSCNACVNACKHRPGWFKPDELKKTAKLLNISLKKLFKEKFAVDWWEGVNGSIFLIAPAIKGQKTGKEYPAYPRGECIFFENGKCSIHEAKPFECAEFIHTDNNKDANLRHEMIAKIWLSKQDFVKKLLGRKPKSKKLDMFDIFDML
mgnify:CR=1 FL=1